MYKNIKRFFDFLFSFIVLILLSPLLIPISIGLKLTGEGHIFYLQKRVGFENNIFNIYKFATMLKDSPNMAGGIITTKKDPRITPMGGFLRKSKINELPQILNILKGDMSFVGPYINGDGSYSRDFTYVANAVQANILGLFTEKKEAINQIYNVACGERTTLNELWGSIKEICGTPAEATHRDNRIGDVPHSLADISKIEKLLGYEAKIKVKEGMDLSYRWYESIYKGKV